MIDSGVGGMTVVFSRGSSIDEGSIMTVLFSDAPTVLLVFLFVLFLELTTLRFKVGLQTGEFPADLMSREDGFGDCPKPPDFVSLGFPFIDV